MKKIVCTLFVIVSWFAGLSLLAQAQSLFTFEKIAGVGDEMPGNPGTYFGGSPAFSNPSLDGSYLGFIGAANGAHGYKAVYVVSGGVFNIVADTNTTMPGYSLTFRDFNSAVHHPLSLSGGNVAFHGANRSTPVPTGIYTNIGGSLNIVADLNTPPPNSTDSFTRQFGIPAIDGENVVFSGGNATQESIYTMIGGSLQVVADLNTQRPGTTGNFDNLASNSPVDLVNIEGSDVVFSLAIGNASEQSGVYTTLGGSLSLVADENTLIPGQTSNFDLLSSAQIDEGDIVFWGANNTTEGIYLYRDSQISVLVDSNTQIPGELIGRTFVKTRQPSQDQGRLAFIGTKLVNFFENICSLHYYRDSNLIKVLESNDILDGKAVWVIYLSPQALSGNDIAFKVTFSDYSEGIYVARYSPANQPPTAEAGVNQSIHVGQTVTLDGSASSDPDENYPLSYAWEMVSKPDGSAATLSDSDSVSPSFIPDLLGDYTVELIVTDSLNASSVADQVLMHAYNTPPVADPGPNQAVVELGTTVQLDGCDSYDLDGDNITYSWTFTAKPAGSNANLNDSTLCNPTFTADVQGDYLLSLVVLDVFGSSSDSETVTISFDNVKPVADAGDNQAVFQGDTVNLDGLGSFDANLDPLSFNWSVVSKPNGSAAEIDDPALPQTSFLADLAGTYVISLVVNDGYEDSETSYVEVVAIAYQDAVTESLQETITEINNISDNEFKNQKMKNALTNKINSVLEMIDDGLYQEALDKLQNDILDKTNGCVETGDVDKNDWILNCDDQNRIYPIIMEAMEHLTALI